jgi:hypothetical protein
LFYNGFIRRNPLYSIQDRWKNIVRSRTSTIAALALDRQKPVTRGKYASSTESRRIVWEHLVWPFLLQINRQYFTREEYRIKKDEFSTVYNKNNNNNISTSRLSGGLMSLVQKGILTKEKNLYSLDYRLVPYMREKVILEYGFAAKQTYAKQ